MNRIILIILFLPLSIFTYAELSYSNFAIIYTDSDGADGGGFAGSLELNDSVYLVGSFSHQEADLELFGDTAETDTISLGIGYHSPISESTDFVIAAQYIDYEADIYGTKAEDDGYSLSGGIRSMVSGTVELNAGVMHISDGDNSETGITLGAAVNVSDSIALIASYVNIDSDDAIGFGVRFGF